MCATQPWRLPHIGLGRSGNTEGTAAAIPRPRRPPTANGAQQPPKPPAKRSRNLAGSRSHGTHGQRREANRVVWRKSPARVGFLAPRQPSAGQSLGSNMFEINSIWRKSGVSTPKNQNRHRWWISVEPTHSFQNESSSLRLLAFKSLSPAHTSRMAAEREILSSVTHLERIGREVRHTWT